MVPLRTSLVVNGICVAVINPFLGDSPCCSSSTVQTLFDARSTNFNQGALSSGGVLASLSIESSPLPSRRTQIVFLGQLLRSLLRPAIWECVTRFKYEAATAAP